MKLRIQTNQMEDVEGLHNEYPYAYHYADLENTSIPWHWHEALELNFVSAGTVKVYTPNQTQIFQAGEGFFTNSNVLVSMENVDGCILDSHLFHPVFLSGHFKSVFETKYLNPVIQNRNLDLICLRSTDPVQRQVLGKLQQLTRLQAHQDAEFQTRNLLSEIWLLLLEIIRNTDSRSFQSNRHQERILTMIAFIQENFAEKLTLENIADSAAVSTRECLRCFQSAIRQSPMDYLISYRIQVAKKLLETTDHSITEIALRCGFNSNSYFTKIFHRTCGKNPNAYRAALKDLRKNTLTRQA